MVFAHGLAPGVTRSMLLHRETTRLQERFGISLPGGEPQHAVGCPGRQRDAIAGCRGSRQGSVMRADMAKVIVERPRKKGRAWNKPKGYPRRLRQFGEDGPPCREGIKARWQ